MGFQSQVNSTLGVIATAEYAKNKSEADKAAAATESLANLDEANVKKNEEAVVKAEEVYSKTQKDEDESLKLYESRMEDRQNYVGDKRLKEYRDLKQKEKGAKEGWEFLMSETANAASAARASKTALENAQALSEQRKKLTDSYKTRIANAQGGLAGQNRVNKQYTAEVTEFAKKYGGDK